MRSQFRESDVDPIVSSPTAPAVDARGGRFYVFRDGMSPIHEDDLTVAQRQSLALPPLPAPPTQDTPHVTEEGSPDV